MKKADRRLESVAKALLHSIGGGGGGGSKVQVHRSKVKNTVDKNQ